LEHYRGDGVGIGCIGVGDGVALGVPSGVGEGVPVGASGEGGTVGEGFALLHDDLHAASALLHAAWFAFIGFLQA